MYPLEALKNTLALLTDDQKCEYLYDMRDACYMIQANINRDVAEQKFVVGQTVYMNNGNLFIGVLKEIKLNGDVSVLWDGHKKESSYRHTDVESFTPHILTTLLPLGSEVVMCGEFPGAKKWFQYRHPIRRSKTDWHSISVGMGGRVKVIGYDGIRVKVELNDGSEFVALGHTLDLESIGGEDL